VNPTHEPQERVAAASLYSKLNFEPGAYCFKNSSFFLKRKITTENHYRTGSSHTLKHICTLIVTDNSAMISDFPHSLTLMQNSHTYVSDPYERSGGCKTLLHRYVLVSLQLTYNSMPECNFQTSAPARPRYTHETPGKGGQIQQKYAVDRLIFSGGGEDNYG
jgi:hypothetical protein